MEVIKRQLLLLSSVNRTSGSIQDAEYKIPSGFFEAKQGEVFRITFIQFLSLNDIYPVRSGRNTFYLNGDPIVIPDGFYSTLTLRNVLTGLMTGYTVEYKQNINGYRFSRATPFTLSVGNAQDLLGFPAGFTSGSTTQLTSTRPVKMAAEEALFIHTDLPRMNEFYGNMTSQHFQRETVFATVPIQVQPFNLILYRDLNSLYQFTLADPTIMDFSIWITDEFGNEVSMNSEYQIILSVETLRPVGEDQTKLMKKLVEYQHLQTLNMALKKNANQ